MQPNAFAFNEAYCDGLLDSTQLNGKYFKYRPKLLCVGKKMSLSYDVFYTEDVANKDGDWLKVDNEFLKKNPQITKAIYTKNMVDPDGNGFYQISVGSCYGDSGGPMFIKGLI